MSSKTKFTKGPWQVETASIRGIIQEIFVRVDGDETAIASDIRDRDGNFCYANAHLIAAAPELYEALESLLDDVGFGRIIADTSVATLARAVLAKARGGE